jgi:predicted TIM-barrel fold metal-dependent hydrolase
MDSKGAECDMLQHMGAAGEERQRNKGRVGIARAARLLLIVSLLVAGCGPRSCGQTERSGGTKAESRGSTVFGYTGARVDAHTHVSTEGVSRLLDLMSRYGVDHAVNFSGGWPARPLERSIRAADRTDGRMSVMCNLPWQLLSRMGGFPQKGADALAACKKLGAKGLKINKVLGLAARDRQGRLVPVDDPRLDPIFDAAGRLGLPVAIHTADPKAFWSPVDPKNERYAELSAHPGWSYHGREVPSWKKLLGQLERRVARHPKTVFVGVHFGNAAEEPGLVDRMLDRYSNYYVDTAARIPELGRHDAEKMRRLFIKHQDRILYGSDLGVGTGELMLGSTGPEPPGPADVDRFFKSSYRYFETRDRGFAHPTPIQGDWSIDGIGLPRDVLAKIYCRNAVRIYSLDVKCK